MKEAIRDIVIVGAGLAGSGLAAALAARGWDVLLVERDRFPRHKVCGEFLSPESQASLCTLGLHRSVAALGPAAMGRARFVARGGLDLTMALPGTAWGLSRYALDAALAAQARAAGAELREGLAATALRREGQGYLLELRDGAVRARAAAVACGRHAPPGLRPAPQATRARRSYVGVKCHYADLAMPAQVEIYLFAGGYAGLGPIEGGRANLCLLVERAAFQRAGGKPMAMLDAACRLSPALGARMAGAHPLAESLSVVANVDTERVPLPWQGAPQLGDTVAMIPPLCGDGMAMALRAAELLAPMADAYLRGALTLEGWQQRYATAWRAEFDGPLAAGRRLQALLGLPLLGAGLLGAGRLLPWAADRLVRATRGAVRP